MSGEKKIDVNEKMIKKIMSAVDEKIENKFQEERDKKKSPYLNPNDDDNN